MRVLFFMIFICLANAQPIGNLGANPDANPNANLDANPKNNKNADFTPQKALEPLEDSCRDDIVGYWLTPRDKESGRTSIVEFIKKDGQYFAYNVVFMDSLDGGKDENNQDYSLRDREVLGSVYIYNLEKNTQTSYIKGGYYDFNIGKVFHLRARRDCDKLVLIISVDNAGIISQKKIYKYLSRNDVEFYIKNKKPEINFSGIER